MVDAPMPPHCDWQGTFWPPVTDVQVCFCALHPLGDGGLQSTFVCSQYALLESIHSRHVLKLMVIHSAESHGTRMPYENFCALINLRLLRCCLTIHFFMHLPWLLCSHIVVKPKFPNATNQQSVATNRWQYQQYLLWNNLFWNDDINATNSSHQNTVHGIIHLKNIRFQEHSEAKNQDYI
jgi:hypothetical protein